MSIEAGTLNRRITIERPATVEDAAGQPIDRWNLVATPSASIRHVSGLESIRGGAEVSAVKVSIRIRYRTDITAGMRVTHGATIYEINAVMPDESGRDYCDLVCQVIA